MARPAAVRQTWLAVLPALIVLALVLRTAWISDDAFITLRTVDNWLHGEGLRWNVRERVQAYTHPLWMFALSAVYALIRQPFAAAASLGVVATTASLVTLGKLARSGGHAFVAIMALAASRSFIDFSTSGLENPLSHALLGAFVLCYVVRRDELRMLAGLAALIALNRVDAVLLVAPALAHAGWLGLRERGVVRTAGDVLIGFSPWLAWEAFSLLYYGAFVPNTAFAKLNTGVAKSELASQGIVYIKDALAWDLPILLVIGAGLGAAIAGRRERHLLLAVGIALYLLYVVRIGGDFMLGRFLTLPLFAAACLIALSDLPLEQRSNAALVLAPLGLLLVSPNATEKWPVGQMSHDGIADERAWYRDSSSFMMWTRTRELPNHFWAEEAQRAKANGDRVIVSGNVGFLGFFAGPSVHIIDWHALTDPLLSRLPARVDPFWRIGHYAREIPPGYVKTIETGLCQFADESLCDYYAKLDEVISGDLWSWHRLKTILALNLGHFDDMLDVERYRYAGRMELRSNAVSEIVLEGAAWNALGMKVMPASGALIRFGFTAANVKSLKLSLDGNDEYLVELRRGPKVVAEVLLPNPGLVGTHTREVQVPPAAVPEGFDELFVLPKNGDNNYSLGYVRLVY